MNDQHYRTERMFDRDRSSVSTLITSNTSQSRHQSTKKFARTQHSKREDDCKKPLSDTNQQTSKERTQQSSILDRLTIVQANPSSRRKKSSRDRALNSKADEQPLPKELVWNKNIQENISMIPDDSFGNSYSMSSEYESLHEDKDTVPNLFTFDFVPSLSEDASDVRDSDEDYIDDNDTTGANFDPEGRNDDDDSEWSEEDDERCTEKNFQTQVLPAKVPTGKSSVKDQKQNMDTLAALGKLELSARTRTASTGMLSEVSSYDTPVRMPDSSVAFETRKQNQQIHDKASRCVGFNIFSIFE